MMIVADLRQHLLDLAKLLDAAKARPVAKELTQAADALIPFGAQSFIEFTRFLALAHEYHTNGKLEAPAKPARVTTPKTSSAPVDIAQIVQSIRALYDRAGDLSLTIEQIEREMAPLNNLKKDDLLQVCERMELVKMKSKNIGPIRDAIRQKILDRRIGAQRAEMTQPPPAQ